MNTMVLNTVPTKRLREVQSGDLLAFTTAERGSFMGRLVQNFIRVMTLSEYAHVGVAITLNGIPHVLEAIQPKIIIRPLKTDEVFYVVPMHIEKHDTNTLYEMMQDYIGCKYSIWDCIQAYVGRISKRDDRWQCAELAADLYERLELTDFKPRRKTPSHVVKAAMLYSKSGMWIHE